MRNTGEYPALIAPAMLWLAIAFPILAIPELIWPAGRIAAVTVAVISAALGVILLAGVRPLAYLVGVLAVVAVAAWARVADQKEALTHLCSLSLGLLSMGVITIWCTTKARLSAAVGLFLLAGCTALSAGLLGTTTQPYKLIPLDPSSLPQLKLGLPGLPANGWVNPNALGGTALMVIPVALAAAFTPLPLDARRLGLLLRVLGGVTAALGIVSIVIGQSRNVWLAAWLTAIIGGMWSLRRFSHRLVLLVILAAVPLAFAAASRGATTVELGRVLGEGQFAASFRMQIIWTQAIEHLRTSPWLGIGLNQFRHVYRAPDWLREGTREAAHAHNIWLQTALDVGLVGLTAYVVLLAVLLRQASAAVRAADPTTRGVALGSAVTIIGVHLFGFGDAVSLGARVGWFQWLAAGFVVATWRLALGARTDAAVPIVAAS